LNAGIEKLDLKRVVYKRALLADELIETRNSYLAGPVGGAVNSAIGGGSIAVQSHPEANGLPVLRRAQDEV
jgi:hypothetical protein